MPSFPLSCRQRLRNAGLGVYTDARQDLNEKADSDSRPCVKVTDGQYSLYLYSSKGKWIVEASYFPDEKCACDFESEFATPEEGVEDAIKYFKKDERWELARDQLSGSERKA